MRAGAHRRAAGNCTKVRNIAPGMKRGLWFGLVNGAWETYVTFGKSPWTLKNKADWSKLQALG